MGSTTTLLAITPTASHRYFDDFSLVFSSDYLLSSIFNNPQPENGNKGVEREK
jgi:hypothetical protein